MNYKCSECDDPVRVVTSAPIRLAILLLLGEFNGIYHTGYPETTNATDNNIQ